MKRSPAVSQLLVTAVGALLLAATLLGLSALLVPRDAQPASLLVGNILAVAAVVLLVVSLTAALLGWALSRLRDLRCAGVGLLAALFLAALAFNP